MLSQLKQRYLSVAAESFLFLVRGAMVVVKANWSGDIVVVEWRRGGAEVGIEGRDGRQRQGRSTDHYAVQWVIAFDYVTRA